MLFFLSVYFFIFYKIKIEIVGIKLSKDNIEEISSLTNLESL